MTRADVAAYVRRHAGEIAREWVEVLYARVPAYRRIPARTLTRNMKWNAEVVAHLVKTGHYPRGSRYIATLAEMRLRYDFTISDVIRAILFSRDVLIVAELSRLGRSMLEIMEILSVAARKKVKVLAVKGEWELGNGLQGKIMAMVLAMAAEIERDLISKRTKAALVAVRPH